MHKSLLRAWVFSKHIKKKNFRFCTWTLACEDFVAVVWIFFSHLIKERQHFYYKGFVNYIKKRLEYFLKRERCTQNKNIYWIMLVSIRAKENICKLLTNSKQWVTLADLIIIVRTKKILLTFCFAELKLCSDLNSEHDIRASFLDALNCTSFHLIFFTNPKLFP